MSKDEKLEMLSQGCLTLLSIIHMKEITHPSLPLRATSRLWGKPPVLAHGHFPRETESPSNRHDRYMDLTGLL